MTEKTKTSVSRGTKDGGKYENPVVGQETLSELKKMFGIHDSSNPNRKGSAKILPCYSAKLVRGGFSVAKTSCTCYQGTFKQIIRAANWNPTLVFEYALFVIFVITGEKVVLQEVIDLATSLMIMQNK